MASTWPPSRLGTTCATANGTSFAWMPAACVSAASERCVWLPAPEWPMLIALGRDPLFQKKTRTDTLYGLVNLMDEARTAPERITSAPPILFLYGANDQIIPAKPTQAVIAALGSKATIKHYDHGYHMLLRDLEGEQVDRDVAAWILGKKPSD